MKKNFKELRETILLGDIQLVYEDFGPLSCKDFVDLYYLMYNLKGYSLPKGE